ncbi:MAG: hypothetical protein JSS07_06240 [Proteobacteria bacterium]|nr:hypothetical protein [Pseudomonadota bacterium]
MTPTLENYIPSAAISSNDLKRKADEISKTQPKEQSEVSQETESNESKKKKQKVTL